MISARILIIEDDADNQAIFMRLLAYAGYRTLAAQNGHEGLEIALRQLPDLIILDLRLPALDGWQVAQLLKAHPRTQHIPLLIVTASRLSETLARRPAVEIDALLQKPFDTATLLREVERLLAGRDKRTSAKQSGSTLDRSVGDAPDTMSNGWNDSSEQDQ